MLRDWIRGLTLAMGICAYGSSGSAQTQTSIPKAVAIPADVTQLFGNPIINALAGGTLLAMIFGMIWLAWGLWKYGKDIKKLNEFETMTHLASLAGVMSENVNAFGKIQQRFLIFSQDIGKVQERMDSFSKDIDKITEQLAQLKGGQDLALAREKSTAPNLTPKAQLDQYWATIEAEWKGMKQTITQLAAQNGITPNFMGQVGVVATMDSLLEKNKVSPDTAAKINDISGRWQYMYRRRDVREDWLNEALVKSFNKSCAEARELLRTNA